MNLINGDIFNDPTGVIAHGVNCQGAFGSGVAGIIRKKFPTVYHSYQAKFKGAKRNNEVLLGTSHIVEINNELAIANCFTQNFYGRTGGPYADLDSIRSALIMPLRWAKMNNRTFKMPMIGCGRGS